MMSEEGLEEVSSLLARNLDPALPAMRAIGVPEIAAFLRGEIVRERALDLGRHRDAAICQAAIYLVSRQPPADWPRFAEPLDCAGLELALAGMDARLS
jgi:tRNA dimethylallyltransferase